MWFAVFIHMQCWCWSVRYCDGHRLLPTTDQSRGDCECLWLCQQNEGAAQSYGANRGKFYLLFGSLLKPLTLSLLLPPFSHLSPHISNNTHSSTMPFWRPLHMGTHPFPCLTSPQATSSWRRLIKKRGGPCWRRSLTDWPQSERWCWRAPSCRGSNWREIVKKKLVSLSSSTCFSGRWIVSNL